ncbi:hypothetical protein TrispH2_002942 [Trichoplax sp. H2]|nr:hypothetical protein TrispH2_002942 [Trichoplax sp. H2]|eukprot:RDD45057.1 hypothetical protein TrispH2_002942 [Trichoplax sp. H2]
MSIDTRSDAESVVSKYSSIDTLNSDESCEPQECQYLESEWSRLTSLLQSLQGQEVHRYLQRVLKKKEIRSIRALSQLLPAHRFPTAGIIHCVRCHHEYYPAHQTPKSCQLYHSPRLVDIVAQDQTGTTFLCHGCNQKFYLKNIWKFTKEHQSLAGYCFQGYHTDDAFSVQYRPLGIAKTCQDNGCIEFYI